MDQLDHRNIERSTDQVEYHPLRPFLPEGAKVLFLGSFPPPRKRWSCNFFYPNFINDHWRIEGLVWFGDKDRFVDAAGKRFRLDEIVEFCSARGIAFFDTAVAVRRLRDNASDKFLEVVEPTDIDRLLSNLPCCRAIVTTGEKAAETICSQMGVAQVPKMGESVGLGGRTNAEGRKIRLYRLPSSSRAYPMKLPDKAEAYKRMFLEVMSGMNDN